MASDPVEFKVAEWRRPIQWANTIQLTVIIAPIFGLFAAGGLQKALGIQWPWNLALGIGVALLGVAAMLYNDHRRMPAGALRLEPGRLLFSGWGRRKWDVAVDRVTILDGDSNVVLIHLRGSPPIRIHQARLDVPLSHLRAAVVQHLGRRAAEASGTASVKATALVFWVRLRQRLPVLIAMAAFLAIVRWWLVR